MGSSASVLMRFCRLFIPVVLFLATLFTLAIYNERSDFRARKEAAQENLLSKQAQVINTELHVTLADAASLVDITLHDLSLIQESKNLSEYLSPEYSAFSKSRLIYDQVRYLDRTGMERVRVNLVDGKPVVVPQAELQNKADRYYFIKGMERGAGEIYLSKLDLNIEHGKIERPYKPMIRVSTPVINEKGDKVGLVVLNYLARGLIERLRKAPLEAGEQVFMVNQQGYWLLGPNAKDEWGFMFPEEKDRTIKALWPEGWNAVSGSARGSVVTREGLFIWDTIRPFDQAEAANGRTFAGVSDDEWKIIFRSPSSSLVPTWWTTAIISFALFMLVPAGFVWAYAESSARRDVAVSALAESRDQLSIITDTLQDAIIMIDTSARVRFWNKTASTMFGYVPAEALGNDMHELICRKDDCLNARTALEEFFRTGKGKLIGGFHIVYAKRKDGSIFPAEISLSSIQVEGEWWAVGVVRDISEREKLESQLRQAQKMEAIGLLAGGVAHDFNNILSIIIGYASFLDAKMADEDPLKDKVGHILAAGEKAANLTQSLLAFGRKQVTVLEPCLINDIVYGFQKMLSRLLTEDIELKLNLAVEDMVVMADRGQLEQVVMNLVTNARDAMPEGGKILVSTATRELDEEFVRTHGFGEPGRYVMLSVEDTGMGIDEKIKEHIFEPFFTTKGVGKGTGLGLSMVYGMVKQHKGHINVYSEPGHGTTFRIYLPLIHGKVSEEETKIDNAALSGSGTILLVEDDKDVRAVTRATLEDYGYYVIEAVDGEDAVRVFAERKDDIDLVVSDVVMPNKNGREAVEEMAKLKPGVKAVFLSGYTADIIQQKGALKGVDVISKPYRRTDFLLRIREILNP